MNRRLVFLHGRHDRHIDSVALKAEWVKALERGLTAEGRELSVPYDAITFPYYGDIVDALATSAGATGTADIVIKGTEDDAPLGQFLGLVLDEACSAVGVDEQQIRQAAADVDPYLDAPSSVRDVSFGGTALTQWTRAALHALDRHAGFTAGTELALTAQAVHRYLSSPAIREAIDARVLSAIPSGVETVVVAHSLGSVVAYNLLRTHAAELGWRINLLVTLGSPLGFSAIRRMLSPIQRAPVDDWFNIADPLDIVAIAPLSATQCNFHPALRTKTSARNTSENHHGVGPYLHDPTVANTIYEALLA